MPGQTRPLGETFDHAAIATADATPWWRRQRDRLLQLAGEGAVYVYDLATVRARARSLQELAHIHRHFYAMKANDHPAVLREIEAAGLGFECVSGGELDHLLESIPHLSRDRILFTPNFASRREYQRVLAHDVLVTLDGLHPLAEWPELFRGRSIMLRLDPGRGDGHHAHVRTAGDDSKFGITLDQLEETARLTRATGATVVGLHAHVGSGITEPGRWAETGAVLAEAANRFDRVRILDLGGGLGVPDIPGQPGLDLAAMDEALAPLHEGWPEFELWLEPGRFLTAEAGALLARVTQVKDKGRLRFVGVETGMNSLIRPALYGAYHHVVNLSRLDEPATEPVHVVGPICESGDVLAGARRLPPAREDDVLLFANAGAYGRVMSSDYNRRTPAREVILP